LSKRFGNLKNGVEDVKKHRFFKGTNFLDILQKKEKPSYVPSFEFQSKKSDMKEIRYTWKSIPEN
jgi:hypothetical protein